MQLPVDIGKLFAAVTDVQSASEMSLSVSVYIDESAPNELAAHVRNAFASTSGNVRMTVSYVGESIVPHPTDDVAVVVAGETGLAGKQAEELRAVGVPAMVVTLLPGRIGRISEAAGSAIPDGDIVSPWEEGEIESTVMDDAAWTALDERMGRWIVAVCREKRLAFAIAFPFMRRPLAKDIIQVCAIENAGIGLIPFIPGADLPLITLNQAKMVLQIAAAYGKSMDKSRLKELAVVIVGAYLSRSLARKLVAAVPGIGFVFKTGVAYGSTIAMGYAVVEYFEGGEDATGVANVLERATATGTNALSIAQEKANGLAPLVSKVSDRLTTES